MELFVPADRVAVVGDLHLNSTTPQSRLDDYPATTLRKLDEIRRICVDKKIPLVILLGDIFHKNQQTLLYLNRVIEVFQRFKEYGIQVFSVVGNHDISYEKLDFLDRSPLQSLFATKTISHLDTVDTGSFLIRGFDYPVALERAPVRKDRVTMCVAHRFFNYTLSDYSLYEKNLDYLGYDVYCLGHDHVQYPVETISSGKAVVRPGSLMRGTSHSYNLSRVPSFDVIYSELDAVGGIKMRFEREELTYQPASEIFTVQSMDKSKDDKVDLFDISEQIDSLIEAMDNKTTSASLYEILDSVSIRPEIKVMIEKYLEAMGVYREIKKES